MVTLQDRVYNYCQKNGLKLGYVAKRIRLDQPTFSMWLHGKKELADYYTRQLERDFTLPTMERDTV